MVVAAAAQATTPTEVLAATGETGAPANRGAYVVSQTFVADAALMPVATGVSSDVAPRVPNGTSALVPLSTGASGAVPARPSGSDYVNPVEFALATSHPVGQGVYPRSTAVDALACNGYRSGVAAQEAFLAAGGPQSDALGLDPDGDGYACGWDPAPYRTAARG